MKNPSNPDLVGSYDTPGRVWSVFVQDSLAYVADRGSGLLIINVSDPTNPDSIGGYYGESEAIDVFLQDTLAYVTDHHAGVQIVNVSDPTNPVLVGGHDTPGNSMGVFVDGEYVYVADRYSLMIFHTPYGSDVKEIEEDGIVPTDFALYQNYPNPFNPATNIEFVLSKSGRVKIEIFNILGQKVRTLVDQHLKAGHKLVDWDGKNDLGKEVSSGIYFYRIKTSEFSQTKKMVLLR